MIAASVFFGWLSTQHIGWLDDYSNAGCFILALLFGIASALVIPARTRKFGAATGFLATLLALAPVVFLAVVLLAFTRDFSEADAILPTLAISLAAVAVLAFKVARRA